MKDKTILEIASSKRVQDAFLARLNPSPEQKLKPRQFVADYLVSHIKDIVNAHETDEALKVKRRELESNQLEIII